MTDTPDAPEGRTVASTACLLGICVLTVAHMVHPWMPTVVGLGLLAAAFIVLQFGRVPVPIRRSAGVLFGVTAMLLPFAQAPWTSLSRGIVIGAMMASLVGSVSLLARGARRSPHLKVVASHLLARDSRSRYTAFSLACQFFGGMIGLAGVTILLDMASRHPVRDAQERTALFVAITRSFSAATMWSPMFSNTAILLSMYPGMSWFIILPICLGMAALAVGLGIALDWQRIRGRPVEPGAAPPTQALAPVLIPMVAAMAGFLATIIAASIVLHIPIMGCIVMLAPLAAIALHYALGSRRLGVGLRARLAARRLRADLLRMPALAGEVMMFLGAGCGGTVIADAIPRAWTEALGHALTGHPVLACLALMIAVVTLASLAVHPVLSTVLIASSLPPAVVGLPVLPHLGSVLAGWCIASTVSPFSMSTLMASRYSGLPVSLLSFRANALYASLCLLISALGLGALAIWC